MFFFQCTKEVKETPTVETVVSQTSSTTENAGEATSDQNTGNASQTSDTTESTEEDGEMSSTASTSVSVGGDAFPIDAPVILAYFPSWSENWVTTGQKSKLRDVPGFFKPPFFRVCKT